MNHTPKVKKIVKVNGVKISYSDFCLEGDIAVIFLNPFPFNQAYWADQAEYLTKQCFRPFYKFRAITYDQRGSGETGVESGNYSTEIWVQDLRRLMDALKIQKAILVGHSSGARIALQFAEKFPTRILGLVLCAAMIKAESSIQKIEKYQLIKNVNDKELDQYAQFLISNMLLPQTMDLRTTKVAELNKSIQLNSMLGFSGGLMALTKAVDLSELLNKINVPTLVLQGELDKITSLADAENIHSLMENSEMHVIPDAGHWSNIDNAVIFNKIVHNYLEIIYNEISTKKKKKIFIETQI